MHSDDSRPNAGDMIMVYSCLLGSMLFSLFLFYQLENTKEDFTLLSERNAFLSREIQELRDFIFENRTVDDRVSIGMKASLAHDFSGELSELFFIQCGDTSTRHGQKTLVGIIEGPNLGDIGFHDALDLCFASLYPIPYFADSESNESAE
jgi:hypothetical protein